MADQAQAAKEVSAIVHPVRKVMDHGIEDVHKKLELVLSGEVSTAQKISEISGRGVGVAAYRDAVLNAGGKLELINSPGEGFEVRATLPRTSSVTLKLAS